MRTQACTDIPSRTAVGVLAVTSLFVVTIACMIAAWVFVPFGGTLVILAFLALAAWDMRRRPGMSRRKRTERRHVCGILVLSSVLSAILFGIRRDWASASGMLLDNVVSTGCGTIAGITIAMFFLNTRDSMIPACRRQVAAARVSKQLSQKNPVRNPERSTS